jgi:hypothetical protein
MTRIPIEIYPLITEFVSHRPTLLLLSTICRAFNYAAEWVLYRQVTFHFPITYPGDIQFPPPHLSNAFHTFWCSVVHPKRGRTLHVRHVYLGYSKHIKSFDPSVIVNALKQFTNLRTLVLIDDLDGGRNVLFREAIFPSLEKFACFDSSSEAFGLKLGERKSFLSFVQAHRCLTHLELETYFYGRDDSDRQRWLVMSNSESDLELLPTVESLTVETASLFIFLPLCPKTRSLQLKLGRAWQSPLPGTFDTFNPNLFQHLEVLTLEWPPDRFSDDDVEGWYSAVLSNSCSLKVLNLRFRTCLWLEKKMKDLSPSIAKIPSTNFAQIKIFCMDSHSVYLWTDDLISLVTSTWFDAVPTLQTVEFGSIRDTEITDLASEEKEVYTHVLRLGEDRKPTLQRLGKILSSYAFVQESMLRL